MSCSLLIDIGNSGAKYSFAKSGNMEPPKRVASSEMLTVICDAAKRRGADKAIISSVADNPAELMQALKRPRPSVPTA